MTLLLARLDTLLRAARYRLQGPADAPRDGVDDDMDQAVLSEQREMTAQTRALLMHRYALLVAAKERLTAGEYGRCLQCGEPIAEARLLAVPEAELCSPCANARERERREGNA